jgi:hypothetical protein
MASATSTAQGGDTYDNVVLHDRENYCFMLAPLTPQQTFQDHLDRLVQSVSDAISDIDREHDEHPVEGYMIGKTGCPKRKGVNINSQSVLNAHNWRASQGPGSRWRTSYADSYHGMIVIAGITADIVPQIDDELAMHQQQYALALEQALIHHFRLKLLDSRCENDTVSSGQSSDNAIGAIYLTFRRA